jgi:uncharacterized protein
MTSIVKRHYDGLRAGRMLAHRCTACGAYTFPMTTACQKCGGFEWEETELTGRGSLLFASHNVAPPPHPRFAGIAPYVYGHVMLEEGIVAQGIVRDVAPEPEAIRKLYEQGPVPVQLDVLETDDLPVLAFRRS